MSLEIDTYNFCEHILSEFYSDKRKLFSMIKEFAVRYGNLKRKIPYHINVIDELHANENAISRILSGLLQYNENGDYILLKSFVGYFMKDSNIQVNNPIITAEKLRIDLLVREKGKYAIIFENKIYDAALQKNQLARYIQKMRREGFYDKDIYVVFLPPREYEPNICSWQEPQSICESCNDVSQCKIDSTPELRRQFKDRYYTITFRNDIINWLKDEVIPNCRQKELFLYSAAIQYCDYLEGYFNIRTNNIEMNMELQDFLSKELGLDNKEYFQQLEIIMGKTNEINSLLSQMSSLKDNVRKKIFKEWEQKIKTEYNRLPLLEDAIVGVTVGTINGKKVDVLINKEGKYYCEVHFDIKIPQEERIITNTRLMELNDILPEYNKKDETQRDCIWKWFEEEVTPDLFDCFIETIERCKDLVDKD